MGKLVSEQQTTQQALAASRNQAAMGVARQYLTFLLASMGKIGAKFVILLDIQEVLSVEEIATLANVREATAKGAEAT